MASLATFKLNGTEYQISDENLDLDTLKSLLIKVINPQQRAALDSLTGQSGDNDDWFDELLASYSRMPDTKSTCLDDADDEALLNSL